jgi:hypothetical protein
MGCLAIARELSPEEQELALNAALACKSMGKISESLGFNDPMAFHRYCKKHPLFLTELQSTRTHAFEELAYSVLTLHEQHDDPQIMRAVLDSIKSFLSWMEPAKYGPRMDLNITQTIDIAGAIERAKSHAEREVAPIMSDINDLV